jgi:hypothetical protein
MLAAVDCAGAQPVEQSAARDPQAGTAACLFVYEGGVLTPRGRGPNPPVLVPRPNSSTSASVARGLGWSPSCCTALSIAFILNWSRPVMYTFFTCAWERACVCMS